VAGLRVPGAVTALDAVTVGLVTAWALCAAVSAHARERTPQWQLGLLFAVIDDGTGFDAEHGRGGHGFVNMADRLGAIGGTVRWESQPCEGARVLGSVPLLEFRRAARTACGGPTRLRLRRRRVR
jgi:signal transduction histidine kinase